MCSGLLLDRILGCVDYLRASSPRKAAGLRRQPQEILRPETGFFRCKLARLEFTGGISPSMKIIHGSVFAPKDAGIRASESLRPKSSLSKVRAQIFAARPLSRALPAQASKRASIRLASRPRTFWSGFARSARAWR